jgi:hypothetical protein
VLNRKRKASVLHRRRRSLSVVKSASNGSYAALPTNFPHFYNHTQLIQNGHHRLLITQSLHILNRPSLASDLMAKATFAPLANELNSCIICWMQQNGLAQAAHIHTQKSKQRAQTHTYSHTHTHSHTHMCIHTPIHTHTPTHMHAHARTHTGS